MSQTKNKQKNNNTHTHTYVMSGRVAYRTVQTEQTGTDNTPREGFKTNTHA